MVHRNRMWQTTRNKLKEQHKKCTRGSILLQKRVCNLFVADRLSRGVCFSLLWFQGVPAFNSEPTVYTPFGSLSFPFLGEQSDRPYPLFYLYFHQF